MIIMELNEIFKELDALPYDKIEEYLETKIAEASLAKRIDLTIPLYNELIGFLRDTTQFDKGKSCKQRLIDELNNNNQQGSMNYATSMLNIANYDRAAGDYVSSKAEYDKTEEIYGKLLDHKDYLWAGLYNNESLLYQAMGDNLTAISKLSQALRIVEAIPERRMEVATTYTNIAQSLAAIGQMDEAEVNINEALKIFAETGNTDYHYSAAAAVMGILEYNKGNYKAAADYYNEAANMVLRIMGDNDNYRVLISNRDAMLALVDSAPNNNKVIDFVKEDESIKGLELCKRFYATYGEPMINEKFADYADRIAVGLFAYGSECYGFDDETSKDHDWGPGFMLLVTRKTYEEIGDELAEAYEKLPDIFMGRKRVVTETAGDRVGVIIIENLLHTFMSPALNPDGITVNRNKLRYVDESSLSALTNGEVWRDDEGIISAARDEILSYYPVVQWFNTLGTNLILTGQSGQYNFKRCLDRGDKVTASMYLSDFYRYALKTLYTINRTYAPYDKWLLKGASNLYIHPEITDCIRAMADMNICEENVVLTIEIIAQLILQSLKDLGILTDENVNWNLELIGRKMKEIAKDPDVVHQITCERLIKLEWEAFDKVENEGGRAFCQDDYKTFHIMRRSQYLTWDDEMIQSYIDDFERAGREGRNLITEKYGRMEKSTAPEEYEKIKDYFPPHTEYQDEIIESICALQVSMMEEVSKQYPYMAGRARSIHTYEDTAWSTSYETYLRGEIGTYSMKTLLMYGRFISGYAKRGENLALDILKNTAEMYGYENMDAAEEAISRWQKKN